MERKQSLFDRKCGVGGRVHSPGVGFGADHDDSEDIAQLKAELLEVRSQLRADQVNLIYHLIYFIPSNLNNQI